MVCFFALITVGDKQLRIRIFNVMVKFDEGQNLKFKVFVLAKNVEFEKQSDS